ncbi:MAG TPA: hypothetical protein VFP44_04600 [Usitatibacter sp.]|nr:hypothetical protein [Usitatibacter sp.]
MPGTNRLFIRSVLVAAVAGTFATGAHAQGEAERIRELEKRLEKSVQLIEQLTARVNELERSRAPAPAAAAAAPLPTAQAAQYEQRIEALERNLSQVSASTESRDFGLPLHGFADVDYDHSTRSSAGNRRSGFALGNLDFYLTPSFGDRVKALAELNFEIDQAGGVATDLERLQVGYTVSDALTAWVGRFHTPYGYWNTAFHHGQQIQTSATRPGFIEFEDRGGILPAHSVGLWLTGRVPAARGRIEYDAYLANGSRIADGVLDFNAFHDDNSHKAVGGRVGYRFGGGPLDGLTLGAHALGDDITAFAADTAVARSRLRMLGAFGVYEANDWESIAEYYRFRNDDRLGDAGTRTSWAGFWQIARTWDERWTPYYRWEKAALDKADPYFASLESARSYARNVLGIRYNINPKAAVKLEAGRTRDHDLRESYTEARAQFAIRF